MPTEACFRVRKNGFVLTEMKRAFLRNADPVRSQIPSDPRSPRIPDPVGSQIPKRRSHQIPNPNERIPSDPRSQIQIPSLGSQIPIPDPRIPFQIPFQIPCNKISDPRSLFSDPVQQKCQKRWLIPNTGCTSSTNLFESGSHILQTPDPETK